MDKFLLYAALIWTAAQSVQASAEALASTTEQLLKALTETSAETIYLNDTLTLNRSSWPSGRTVNLTRSVTITATPERVNSQAYVVLDFSNLAMIIALAPGCTLRFVGLELANHFDTVGPTLRPIYQSVGATIKIERCIQRRLAGLPYSAAVVNMVAASRPAGVPGPQNCSIIHNFTYTNTRNPNVTISAPDAVAMTDYDTVLAPDSSLAFQGLYYGGYTYWVLDSHYLVDHFVSSSCLQRRSGSECVTLLLQELNAAGGPPEELLPDAPGGAPNLAMGAHMGTSGGIPEEQSSSASSRVKTIVPAAVVPTLGVVLILVAAAALFVVRRRRRRDAGGGGAAGTDVSTRKEGASAAAAGDAATSCSAHGNGGGGSKRGEGEGGVDMEACVVGQCAAGTATDAPGKEAGEPSVSRAAEAAARTASGGSRHSDDDGEGSGGGGCIFLGLDAGQKLPKWSAEAAAEGAPTVDDGGDLAGGPAAAAAAAAGPPGSHTADVITSRDTSHVGGWRDAGPSTAPTSGGIAGAPHGECGGRRASRGSIPAAAVATDDTAAAADTTTTAAAVARHGSTGPSISFTASRDVMAELEGLSRGLRTSIRDVQLRLEGVLGCGSYGTVYKGTWQGLSVAVKTLVFSASHESRRRALQEAALCGSISHPNIVATYSSEVEALPGAYGNSGSGTVGHGGGGKRGGAGSRGESGEMGGAGGGGASGSGSGSGVSAIVDWRLYIVQEYADGGPLWRLYGSQALWPSPGAPNIPAVLSLALGISRAVAHLHSKRIVHGDLNPNNVLLKRDPTDPSGFQIKVGDFGLSVLLPHNRSHVSNLRLGTMFYMCPGVVMKAQVGPPADVFSLGVLLWELYHGRPAGTRTERGPRYCAIFPAFPPACPELYSSLALHCLQRQPQNRPSAAEVSERLERLLASYWPPAVQHQHQLQCSPASFNRYSAPHPHNNVGAGYQGAQQGIAAAAGAAAAAGGQWTSPVPTPPAPEVPGRLAVATVAMSLGEVGSGSELGSGFRSGPESMSDSGLQRSGPGSEEEEEEGLRNVI
ncbi:hypothetical protein Agub_g9438 [Astrephomene gubernaculifera]|uniref:Protein kinase domain-containing protein n=1 Tax=Astrephomene gubernaculifera TaxID=47775 RepID=A0AAD3HPB1_9CHLO|nr:hypothetical protein Agub_g9438 [Astrephomene gubernaculifera]